MKKLNRVGGITAFGTFAIASFILFGHYQGLSGDFELYGFYFIPFALIINILVLLFILISAEKRAIKGPFTSIILMLCNIPVAIFYIWFAIFLSGFYRVTIINNTQFKISNIRLTGCDDAYIHELNPNDKETIWININSDCSLQIFFDDKDKKLHQAVVAGYLTPGMGDAESYFISGKNNHD